MALLKVQVETERPGIVQVRAKAAPGREMDSKPVAGFFVRRRFEGDVFMIAEWHEFSPRWMEFVDPDKVPKDWIEKIESREGNRNFLIAQAERENAKSPRELMAEAFMSMAQAAGGGDVLTINQSTGKVTKGSQKQAGF